MLTDLKSDWPQTFEWCTVSFPGLEITIFKCKRFSMIMGMLIFIFFIKKHSAQLTRQEVMGQMSPIHLSALQLPLLITHSPLIRY